MQARDPLFLSIDLTQAARRVRRFRAGRWAGVIEALEPRNLLSVAMPMEFSAHVDNPYLPLVPGTTFIYRGVNEDGESLRQRATVLPATQLVAGVACRVVSSIEWEDGEIVERTRDYFAQDPQGDVWYFGEDSEELEETDDGEIISRDGSWHAGVGGARPGIIMRADIVAGDSYFQENAPGLAEDQAEILGFVSSRNVPFGKFSNSLQIQEFNRLEPDSLEHKYYARGVGFIMSEHVDGELENVRLASVEVAPWAVAAVLANPELKLIPNADELRRLAKPQFMPLRSAPPMPQSPPSFSGATSQLIENEFGEQDDAVI